MSGPLECHCLHYLDVRDDDGCRSCRRGTILQWRHRFRPLRSLAQIDPLGTRRQIHADSPAA